MQLPRESYSYVLVATVRQRLGHAICQSVQGEHDALAVLTLDPALESSIAQNLNSADGHAPFVIDPRLAEAFLGRLLAQSDAMLRQGLSPVLLCRPDIRRHIRNFTRRTLTRLVVLSMNEVPHQINLRSFAMVSIERATNSVLPPQTRAPGDTAVHAAA
ncbi:FHIPEP family type III secretion protein [Caballeronia sp. HLA56]